MGHRRIVATAILAILVVFVAASALRSSTNRAHRNGAPGPGATTAPSSPAPAVTTPSARRAHTPSPAGPIQSPSAASPGAWALPSPSRYEGTAGVGYPHSTLGALAAGYGSLASQVNIDPDIAASVVRNTYLDPTTSEVEEAAQVVSEARVEYGIPPDGPTSATIALSLEACRIQAVTPDRVVAGYEGTLVVEGTANQGVTTNFAKAIAMVWNGTDWRVDPNAPEEQPPVAFPGSPGAAADGWHICSEG
jgi:hypothetical protein